MGVDTSQYNLNEPIDLSNFPKGMAIQFVFSGLEAPKPLVILDAPEA